jgi:N-acetylglutamate synthase and related acetyltransferases
MANMIREMTTNEIDRVGDIWLNSNLEAHDFVDKNYWLNNLETVKEQFRQAEIYVYELDGQICGFAGLQNDYLAGIFVQKDYRNHGIGHQLLDYLKQTHQKLTLDVYDKNERARKFYKVNGFNLASSGIDEVNGEEEYQLIWQKEIK